MALKKRIGKSQTVPFRITAPDAVEIVVIFSGEQSETVYEQFAYPQRQAESSDALDYTLLEVDSNGIYTGELSETATMQVADDLLVADVKIWNALGQTRVKRYRMVPIASTRVENIQPTQIS